MCINNCISASSDSQFQRHYAKQSLSMHQKGQDSFTACGGSPPSSILANPGKQTAQREERASLGLTRTSFQETETKMAIHVKKNERETRMVWGVDGRVAFPSVGPSEVKLFNICSFYLNLLGIRKTLI